jgi:hypothetical protein
MSATPDTFQLNSQDAGDNGPKGIGGWLIVSLLILCFTALRAGQTVFVLLTTPFSELPPFYPGFGFPHPLLEDIATAVQLGVTYLALPLVFVCLVQFIRKARSLPILIIITYSLNAISLGIAFSREC